MYEIHAARYVPFSQLWGRFSHNDYESIVSFSHFSNQNNYSVQRSPTEFKKPEASSGHQISHTCIHSYPSALWQQLINLQEFSSKHNKPSPYRFCTVGHFPFEPYNHVPSPMTPPPPCLCPTFRYNNLPTGRTIGMPTPQRTQCSLLTVVYLPALESYQSQLLCIVVIFLLRI